MSWDQEYHVQSYMELLVKLTGKQPEELLEDCLMLNQGISVLNKDMIQLDDGVEGEKVTLSDGRVFVPKLVEKFTENGNHGIDIYRYCLDSETPTVMNIGLDTSDPDVDSYTVPDNYGEDIEHNYGWEG